MKIKNVNNRRRSRALALIAVLWIIVILTIIITILAKVSRMETRMCLADSEQIRGSWACRAALETAIALLNEDSKSADALDDIWSDISDSYNNVDLERCSFRIKTIDEASKLNLNTVTKEQLMHLPEMTEEIAHALIDWRDQDAKFLENGAENGYYINLHPSYSIRNGPFRTVRELQMVKGVTAELFYGEDTNLNYQLDYNERDGDKRPPLDNANSQLDKGWISWLTCYSYDNNTDAQDTPRVNINQADEQKLTSTLGLSKGHAKWIVESRKKNYKSIADLINKNSPEKPPQNVDKNSDKPLPLDRETFAQIADQITINDSKQIPGLVNINTADQEVLTALFEGSEQLALDVISHRQSSAAMESIAELLQIKSIDVETFKKIANNITTRSSVYTIYCFAHTDMTSAEYRCEAVVDRNQTPIPILYRHQGAYH